MEDRTVLQPAGTVRPGTRLNGLYEIEKLIAQGGMGEVYRGFNIQTMDPVAIKMIRFEFSNNKEIFELFRREASILHNLSHEAIVRYFVFSVDPDLHRAYLAMEFVEGLSLTDRLQKGPLQLGDAQVLRRRVASALEMAHQHGVIHRDISPDNIILPQNGVGAAKVIDFGISRSLYRGEASIIGGRFAGKYNFASPEQFGLAGGEVGLKSDIYSFGLVLAAALRGSPIDMSGSEVEAIAKRSVLPDLSDIDPTMRPLLQAMLQPTPANRPASMAEIAAWEPAPSRALWTPSAHSRESRPLTALPTRERGGGKKASLLGATIVLASIAGTAYVLRDDLTRWAQSVISPAPPSISERPQVVSGPKQPELPNLTPAKPNPVSPSLPQQEAANPQAAPPAPPPVSEAPTGATEATNRGRESAGARPTVDEIVNALKRPRTPPENSPGPAEAAQNPEPQSHDSAATGLSAVHSSSGNSVDAAEAPQSSQSESPESDGDGPPAAPAAHQSEGAHGDVALQIPIAPPPSLAEKARRFVGAFNGGDCFLVKRLDETDGRESYLGFGRDPAPFQRFDTDYKTEVGAEADIRGGVITQEQCAALDLIRLGEAQSTAGPRLELQNGDVGRGKPLTGKITNLGARRVYLIRVDDQGLAYRLEVKHQPEGDAATFNIELVPDGASAGSYQILLAVVSDPPIGVLEDLHRIPLRSIASRVVDEARRTTVFVEADYFKFVD
jgi:eukaryotic-like serine/threonine-protein kinase